MARDIFHPIVREALEKEGWIITHDPYKVRVKGQPFDIDLGAEQVVAAEKGIQKIAVEVKSYLAASFAYEFHSVLGQYLNYETFMGIQEPDRTLYLAVPEHIYEKFFTQEATQYILEKFRLNLVIFDKDTRTILRWIIR
jgi:hypothetical protein